MSLDDIVIASQPFLGARARLQRSNYEDHPMQDLFSPLVTGFWRLHHWGMSDQALLAYNEECLAL